MYILYGLIFLMLFIALSLLALPFIAKKNLLSPSFLVLVSLVSALSLVLYHFSGDHRALEQWFASGKKHYALMEKMDQLGGIDGIIKRVQTKLGNNPDDAQGWLILGKLYITKQDYIKAKIALKKAHILAPDDEQINRFYEISLKQLPQ